MSHLFDVKFVLEYNETHWGTECVLQITDLFNTSFMYHFKTPF